MIILWLFCIVYSISDASVGDSFITDSPWTAFDPSGFEHNDYGLRVAGGRERNSKSTTMFLYAFQTPNRTEAQYKLSDYFLNF